MCAKLSFFRVAWYSWFDWIAKSKPAPVVAKAAPAATKLETDDIYLARIRQLEKRLNELTMRKFFTTLVIFNDLEVVPFFVYIWLAVLTKDADIRRWDFVGVNDLQGELLVLLVPWAVLK